MLLWHVSTAHLVETYSMPPEWGREFVKSRFGGGNGVVWGLVLFVVPLDCVNGVLGLDWWHGLCYARGDGDGDWEFKGMNTDGNKDDDEDEDATTTSNHSSHRMFNTPPHTYHPILSLHSTPTTRFYLLTLYDFVIAAILATHITTYFTFPCLCTGPSSFTSRYGIECTTQHERTRGYTVDRMTRKRVECHVTDPRGTGLSMQERCERAAVDIAVSGPFDVGLCVVLMGLHVWCAGKRWRWWYLRGGKEEEYTWSDAGGGPDAQEMKHADVEKGIMKMKNTLFFFSGQRRRLRGRRCSNVT